MSDFNVEISTTNNQLEIESSIINSLNFNEVNNTIETILSETINNVLEIESSANEILEISTEYVGSVVFASDVIGLENYLSNFIDSYEIDCGTP
jgi:dihydroneopterin aldolase